MKNPADIAKKWSKNTAAAGEDYKQGVNRVTESPTKKAAANLDRYEAGIRKSLEDGKTKRNMEAVTLDDWQKAAIDKGVPNFTAAARRQSVQDNVLNFQEQFLPFVETVAERVRKMPKGTLADGIARAVAQIEGNAEFRYTKRR